MNSKDQKLAVLIDADNVPYANIKGMLEEIAKYGILTIKRIYGDWTKPTVAGWKSILLDYAITPIQQYSYTTGKNATDSAMIIDAMDILHTDKVDGFCIVSSDSDFTRLAVRLRESGKFVLGMGEKKTPNPFIVSCDKFVYIEILGGDIKDTTDNESTIAPKEDIVELLKQSINDLADDNGWAFLANVGSLMLKKKPDFDSRNYGFLKLTALIEKYSDKFEIEKRDTNIPSIKHVYVKNKI